MMVIRLAAQGHLHESNTFVFTVVTFVIPTAVELLEKKARVGVARDISRKRT